MSWSFPAGPAVNDLESALLAVAGSPDERVAVADLRVIADGVARLVEAVDFASVTAPRGPALYTVATSENFIAALAGSQPPGETGLSRQESGTDGLGIGPAWVAMEWPQFRKQAFSCGLHAALSIPLCAGSGAPVAELTLYSRNPAAMASLIPLVVALFHDPPAAGPHPGLGDGDEEFLRVLAAAQGIQRDIQQAFGVLMGGAGLSAAEAYVALCELAEDSRTSLHDVAIELLSRARAEGDLSLVAASADV